MTVSEKHTGLRIIGPRPVERNGLRGFVTTFHFGNTHSPAALLPSEANTAGGTGPKPSPVPPSTLHASRNGEG